MTRADVVDLINARGGRHRYGFGGAVAASRLRGRAARLGLVARLRALRLPGEVDPLGLGVLRRGDEDAGVVGAGHAGDPGVGGSAPSSWTEPGRTRRRGGGERALTAARRGRERTTTSES